MSNKIQSKMAKGAIWMVSFKLIERSIGLVSTLVLARLLSPADFGVISMALSFIFLAELLGAFGFDVALIHNQSATREYYDTAWTCNILLGLSITLIMVLAAFPIANFYKHPELVWVVSVLALGPLISGAENVGVVAFRKELLFHKEFVFQLTRKALGFMIVIPMALALQNYWALVTGILFSKLAATVISYLMHPYRPRFALSRTRELIGFSGWLLMNNLIGFFKERSSDFFIGRLFGADSLGTYNIAYEFGHLPSTELSAPINRALLPGFAKMTEVEDVSRGYKNSLGIMALLAVPCAAGLAVLAPYFVPTVLGVKWLAAVPLMQILAFNGAVLMFHSPICAVLLARGYPQMPVIANGLYMLILLSQLSFIALNVEQFSVRNAAFAALLSSLLSTPLYLYILQRKLSISPMIFMRAIVRPLCSSVLMVLTIHWLLPAYDSSMALTTVATWLLAGIGIGVIVYMLAVLILWILGGRPNGPERVLLDHVGKLFGKFKASSSAPQL
ncbi:MAG TPA: lipopolysaccharide biosynthesis protein [Pseudomonadales bacterium]|nr:lipopolysaccharide biosynthesis protein [Pseudomonadales bacterium]